MADLDSKAMKVAVVIDPDHMKGEKTISVDTIDALERWCGLSCQRWAYALHDLDVKDDGITPKEPHLHVFLELHSSQRLNTTLNKLTDALGYTCNDPISVERCTDPSALVQYFLHLNEPPTKHRYPKDVIRTNMSEETLKSLLEDETAKCSVSYFVGVCARSKNLIQVIETLGLKRYQGWRSVILDIWHASHRS